MFVLSSVRHTLLEQELNRESFVVAHAGSDKTTLRISQLGQGVEAQATSWIAPVTDCWPLPLPYATSCECRKVERELCCSFKVEPHAT